MYTQEEIETTKLDGLIDEIVEQLSGLDSADDQYAKMVDQLSKLYKLKQIETELKLKTNDQDLKDRELYANIEVKDRDSRNKESEILSGIRVKDQEADLRREELDAKIRVMDVEIESKKDEVNRRRRVSPDTMALIAANLAGIAVIIGYERINVITSKALGFVARTR